MNIPLYIVDAFTATLFRGNPAAVCPLRTWLPDALMQSIAAENNLAETAFLVPEGRGWRLRWFTPQVEIELCGHATLASAFVLAMLNPGSAEFRFHTLSGELIVTRQEARFILDFPVLPLETTSLQAEVGAALGVEVREATRAGRKLLAELDSEEAVRNLIPDFSRIKALDCSGLIVTARGEDSDFVSRYFAPRVGIDEDPVTGSAHCALTPYWGERLGKSLLQARQVSARGGELSCELRGDRVLMGGQAVLYGKGEIFLP